MDEKMDVIPGYTLDAIVRQEGGGRCCLPRSVRRRPASDRQDCCAPSSPLRESSRSSTTRSSSGVELDSPAAVRTLSFEASGNRFALVFEEWRMIPRRAARAPMEVGRPLNLAVGIAEALADLHRRGVIHKNVCPENLVVDPEMGRVQLTDFALASRWSENSFSPHAQAGGGGASPTSRPSRQVAWSVPSTRARTSTRRASCCTRCSPGSCPSMPRTRSVDSQPPRPHAPGRSWSFSPTSRSWCQIW